MYRLLEQPGTWHSSQMFMALQAHCTLLTDTCTRHTPHHTPPVGGPHSVAHAHHLTPTCRSPVVHQFRTLLTATDAKSAPCPHSSPPPPSLRAVSAVHSVCSMQGLTARQARDTEHMYNKVCSFCCPLLTCVVCAHALDIVVHVFSVPCLSCCKTLHHWAKKNRIS